MFGATVQFRTEKANRLMRKNHRKVKTEKVLACKWQKSACVNYANVKKNKEIRMGALK